MLVMVLSGCARRMPDGSVIQPLPRCEHPSRGVVSHVLEDAANTCRRWLDGESGDVSRSFLGVDTGPTGRVTRVCVNVSSEASDSRFLTCVVDEVKASYPDLPPNRIEAEWQLTLSY